MTWTNPKAWAGSEVLTAADMNTYVGSNTEYVYDNTPISNQWLSGTTSVAQLNQRIESGTAYIGLTKEVYGSTLVTYNTAYGTAPRVVTSDTSALSLIASPRLIGTSTFRLFLVSPTGTVTGSAYPDWIAIGA